MDIRIREVVEENAGPGIKEELPRQPKKPENTHKRQEGEEGDGHRIMGGGTRGNRRRLSLKKRKDIGCSAFRRRWDWDG